MKYAHLILTLISTFTLFTESALSFNDDNRLRTIILINGAPYLVDMDREGNEISAIAPVSEYFESAYSHLMILDRASADYAHEFANIKSRLLIFDEESAVLDFVAIDHIRDIARLYDKGYIDHVSISAGHTNDFNSEALAAHRIAAIYHMLKDFGMADKDIGADTKYLTSDTPNQYVRLNINKDISNL